LPKDESGLPLEEAIRLFRADKENQGVTDTVKSKYERELDRLRAFCERHSVFTVQAITRELLIGYAATWPDVYGSTMTRYQAFPPVLHGFRLARSCPKVDADTG
jgi:hypothetical protein